jgi:AraC family transcriptional regulator, positive regulator of tynA and feaB
MSRAAMSGADFEACNDAISRVCGAYRVVCDRWWEFRGGIATRKVGSLEVADIRFSNGRVIKDGRRSEYYLGDRHFLVLQVSGSALMRQRGREAYLKPGDCTLIDSRYPSVFEIGEDFRQHSFHLPAELIHDRFGSREVPLAQTISGSRGAGGVLSDTLMSILRHGETLEGVDLTELALNLLCRAVGLSGPAEGHRLPGRTVLGVQEISDYIDAQLSRPELAPREIAEYFNVSLRQLYRISALAGCTPAALIWRRRLHRARELLQQPASRAPITEIALSCGFKDGAHFSRSYRRTFGEAPRSARRSLSLIVAEAAAGALSSAV